MQAALDEVARELDGEDPLLRDFREELDGSLERLRAIHQQCQEYTGPFELPEPQPADVAAFGEAVQRFARILR